MMNIYKSLNQVINYIENNLDKEISYLYISKLLGTNQDTAKRLFSLITNISLNEYIKKRRLSKSAYEIENTNFKIIDIAFKYGYNNPNSFTRAFKSFHNCLPNEVKINKTYKNYPPFIFNEQEFEQTKYKIKNLKTLTLYGNFIEVSASDIPTKINEFWKSFRQKYNENIMYGILTYDDKKVRKYWICLDSEFENSTKLIINNSKYISLKIDNLKENNISKKAKAIHKQYIYSSDFKIVHKPNIEIYKKDKVELLFPVK